MASPGAAAMRDRTTNTVGALLMFLLSPGAMADRVQSPPSERGRTVYQQYCAGCHGAKGEGVPGWERPDEHGELPAPPHDHTGHTWKHSDAMLYRIVQQGWRDPFNKTERSTMPGFKGQLSRQQTISVIAYLKSLWTSEQRQFQAQESRRQPFPLSR
ncbi:MAG: cytochrome c [Pseudomonadota bacterium]|nr:cytochrome c [Pseudomonadota bacterium]